MTWSYSAVHVFMKSTENFLFVDCLSAAVLPGNIWAAAFLWDWARCPPGPPPPRVPAQPWPSRLHGMLCCHRLWWCGWWCWAPDRWGILCRFPPQPGPPCLLDSGRVELQHTRPGVLHSYLPYFFCCTACFWWYSQWFSYPGLCFQRWCRTLVLLAGRGSYPRTSTGDCCTGRHPRQVFLYPSDNRNPPQCPSGDLYLLNHLDYHGPPLCSHCAAVHWQMVLGSLVHGKFLGALCPW